MLAGRYRLGDVLGRGGMGKVWRAHDEVLHRTVAVKELTAGLYVAEADRLVLHARTQKEARAAARITHPGVVTVHDVIEYDNRPWIVMQYVDGPSLADSAKESGEVAPREAARIGLHVLSALRAAHSAGVLHRDVKPGNVLLARDGQVLLTDFGIAAIEGDSTITRTGELVGSIDYLAPERVRGGDPGPASDLWSLGATLYTAVEGTSPFRRTSPISTMQAVVTEEPPAPVNAGPLGPVIIALLRKDPDDRPTAAQTEQMLLDAMDGREPRAAQAHVPTQRFPEDARYGYQDANGPGGPNGSDGATARLPGATPSMTAPPAPVPDAAAPVTGPASAPVTRRAGSRWRTVLVVVVAAAVLGGGAGLFAMKYREGSDTPGGTSGGTAAGSTPSAEQTSRGGSPRSPPPRRRGYRRYPTAGTGSTTRRGSAWSCRWTGPGRSRTARSTTRRTAGPTASASASTRPRTSSIRICTWRTWRSSSPSGCRAISGSGWRRTPSATGRAPSGSSPGTRPRTTRDPGTGSTSCITGVPAAPSTRCI